MKQPQEVSISSLKESWLDYYCILPTMMDQYSGLAITNLKSKDERTEEKLKNKL